MEERVQWSISFAREFHSDNAAIDLSALPRAVCLPLISPFPIQPCFVVKGDVVLVIVRESYQRLKAEILITKESRSRGMFLLGPAGIGKSHLLYILAYELLCNRAAYRVTYVNDCHDWSIVNSHIFVELAMTFFDNEMIISEIELAMRLCSYTAVNRRSLPEQVPILLGHIKSYLTDNNLKWIIVLDQINAFYGSSSSQNEDPLSFIRLLSAMGSPVMVVSASANNEGYPTEFPGWTRVQVVDRGFSDQEFELWCQYIGVNSTDTTLKAVRHWTGGIPIELTRFHETIAPTLKQKLQQYLSDRKSEITAGHTKFFDSINTQQKTSLAKCIVRMSLGLDPPVIYNGMDRQLLDIVMVNDSRKIVALNPIIRQTLLDFHSQSSEMDHAFKMTAEIIFSDTVNYLNETKGKVVERYIILSFENTKSFMFTGNLISNQPPSQNSRIPQAVIFEGKDLEIVYFHGNGAPDECPDTARTIVFVPESSNYPKMDFFIWKAAEKQLLAIQVTVKRPVTSLFNRVAPSPVALL
jgi:hypothetical protein